VHQNVPRDYLIDNILGDIEKGVTTRSRVANFLEHYSFFFFFWAFQGRRCTTWSGLGGGYARRIEQLQAQWSVVFGWKTKAKCYRYQMGILQ
jgi:hypothetical protein